MAKALGLCTPVGIPGFWLLIDSAPPVVTIWGVSKQMEFFSVSHLHKSVFPIKTNISLKVILQQKNKNKKMKTHALKGGLRKFMENV